MMKVSASRLKAKMGQYMKAVRAGKVLIITDREEPVARLTPYSPDSELPATGTVRDPDAPPLGKVKIRGIRPRGTDSLRALQEDRDRR